MISMTDLHSAHAAQTGPGIAIYEIDPAHSRAHFRVRHLMVAFVRGELGVITGTALFNTADPARSGVEVAIDAAAINTGNGDRDAHLRSADFFDVASYPSVSFRSTAVALRGAGILDVTGDLTIRGVTRPVVLAVELSDEIRDPDDNFRRGVTATTRVNRKEFGVNWNATMDSGGVVVADHVDITIEAELVRPV